MHAWPKLLIFGIELLINRIMYILKFKKKYKITPPYPTTIWHNLENFCFFQNPSTLQYFTLTASISWVEENDIDSYVPHAGVQHVG